MIIARLEGGLGNQLFQYANALALQQRCGGRLVFDRRLIRAAPSKANALAAIADISPDGFADRLLANGLRWYAGACIRIVRAALGCNEKAARRLAQLGVRHQFQAPFVDLGEPARLPIVYLHGNFMSEKYFLSAIDLVRSSIHPERALNSESKELVGRIATSNAVAVHVRRGDYLSERWRDKLEVCTEDYYQRAVAMVLERVKNPTFYLFTTSIEDMTWVRDNYRFLPKDTVFVPLGVTDVEHFALMTLCRHFILANSTFSWWASYLSRDPQKVVVAPSPWNRNVWDMTDIYCPGWNIIELDLAASSR